MIKAERIKAVEGIIRKHGVDIAFEDYSDQTDKIITQLATQIVEAIGVDEEKVRTQLVPLPLCFKDAAHMQTRLIGDMLHSQRGLNMIGWIDNTAHAIANADILTVKGE